MISANLRAWWYAHHALRDLVLEWDPIGIGEDRRPQTENEYDCILDKVYIDSPASSSR